MFGDPKSVAELIVKKGAGPMPAPDETEGEGEKDKTEPDEAGLAAAEEFQKAVKGGSAADVLDALHNLVECCYPELAK